LLFEESVINITYWKDERLVLEVTGEVNRLTLKDRIFDLTCKFDDAIPTIWTRLIKHENCIETEDDITKERNEILRICSNAGCKATAFVIPEDKLDLFINVYVLSEDANNGVRIFYCDKIAELWLEHQNRLHRRKSLH
jgi:hypothetical protein